MAFHGCPVLDRDHPGHGHCVDREIMQKTALGMYILIYIFTSFYLTTYIIDQKMCTMYPITCSIFNRKIVCLYGGLHMYILGQSAFQIVFNLCSF